MSAPLLAAGRARLRGVVEGEGIALRRVHMVAGGAVEKREVGRELVITTEAGQRVRVDLADDIEIVPARIASGRWSSLERDEAARLFRNTAPAPHVHVRLVDCAIRAGEAIELEAEVLEEAPTEAEAYREAGGTFPSRVRASVLAIGEQRVAELEKALVRRDRAARGGWLVATVMSALGAAFSIVVRHLRLFLAGLSLAVAVGSLTFGRSPVAMYGFALGMGCVGIIATWGWYAKEHPRLSDGSDLRNPLRVWGGIIFFPPILAVLPALVALWSVFAAIAVTVQTFRSSRLIRTMFSTSTHPEELADEPWGTLEGKIAEVEPESGSVTVATHRSKVAIDATNALWSSLGTAERKPVLGGKTIVLGRLRRVHDQLRMSATGPESLVYFISLPDSDVRRELRALVRRRHLTRALLFAIAVAVGVHALWILPTL